VVKSVKKVRSVRRVATGRRLRTGGKSLMKPRKEKSGEYKKKKVSPFRVIEVESHVTSPRGRALSSRGIVSPLERPPEEMPQSVQDFFLSSRAIARYAYDMKKRILEIWFTTGAAYQFYSVPYDVWRNLKKAQSKGRFFHDYIYGEWRGPKGNKTYFPNYTYRKIN
jgi:hypothetical protein